MTKCLLCYQPLNDSGEYHPRCSTRFFGKKTAPAVDFTLDDIEQLATQEVNARISVTGVQRKLSLELTADAAPRLTIVGLWGSFIFKPPTSEYPFLPEIEDLSMHLAAALDIRVASHGLVRLRSNELGYVCRRFDRVKGRRLAVEDFCQLTETLTSDKYYGSVERVGRTLRRLSDVPGFDAQRLLEVVLFSFLIGNSDMHLKNYALLRDESNELSLSPAYDLVATLLMLPEDKEESALSINGRKNKLQRCDFVHLAEALQIPAIFLDQTITTWRKRQSQVAALVRSSFVPEDLQDKLLQIITQRLAVLS